MARRCVTASVLHHALWVLLQKKPKAQRVTEDVRYL